MEHASAPEGALVDVPLTTSVEALLDDAKDERFRAFVHELLAFGARLREVRDSLAELIGLGGPTYTILISVAHLAQFGEVGVNQVARHLNLSQPYVTAEVQKLVTSGLVDKSRSAADGRSVSLTVTEDGRGLLRRLAPDQRDVNDRLFGSLDRGTFDVMSAAVTNLVADVERAHRLARERVAARNESAA